MKKSDLCQISNLIDERLDLKFDEKLKNITTKDDLDIAVENVAININQGLLELELKMDERFNKNTKQHNEIFSRLDKIEEKIIQQPTRSEIFDKWDNEISQMSCDVDSLKYLHKDEWKNIPTKRMIKHSI